MAQKSNPPPARSQRGDGPGIVDYGLLFFLASLWGGSFILIKTGVEAVMPATMTAMRLVFAAAAMWFALAVSGARLPTDGRSWRFIIAVATVGTVLPFFLISWGQQGIATGLTAILMGVMPLTTMVMAHFALSDDKLTWGKAAGVSLGFGGLITLVGPSLLSDLGKQTLSQLAIAAAATCYGASAIITRGMMRPSVSQIGLATGVMSVAAVIMVAGALFIDGLPEQLPTGTAFAAILCLGVVQTGFAQILLFRIVARQGPSFFSQINFLVPFLGVLWGAFVFEERLGFDAWIALGLIILGLAVARFRF